ncbi:MAG TPA: VOC family protein [Chitinophagaceae bacterium]|nr:VOC family protein [Chitinophagaceae bacterium]HPH31095.1 VOC family protein [Chitinophagaceae bacterium]HPN58069.1 VOC family protein [Chitinophagaceae bacterium]
MRIQKLVLQTTDLQRQYSFYIEKFNFQVVTADQDHFSFSAGASLVEFRAYSGKDIFPYHLAFTIPAGQLIKAADYLAAKGINLVKMGNQTIFQFESWNATSLYFRDPDENILELIVRFNLGLKNGSVHFSPSDIIQVSEIGIVADDPQAFSSYITEQSSLPVWKMAGNDFIAMGDEEGLLIVVQKNRNWYPTDTPARAMPVYIHSPAFNRSIQADPYLFAP